MTNRYRIAGVVVDLPASVHGLLPEHELNADLVVSVVSCTPPSGELLRRVMAEEAEWLRIESLTDPHRLAFVFPEYAVFVVDASGRQISIHPPSDADEPTLTHLLLDNVLPMYLASRGALVLHASSIAVDRGGDTYAVLFIGASGSGKSSTAAACAMTGGASLLSDDFAVIDLGDRGPRVFPANVGSRLWQDSASVVAPEAQGEVVASYLPKVRLTSRQGGPVLTEPVPIGLLAFMGPRLAQEAAGPELTLAPLPHLFMDLVRHSFRADEEGAEASQVTLDQTALLLNAVPARVVHMPDDLLELERSAVRLLQLADDAHASTS